MNEKSYQVLIIEDDFRVAEINRRYIERTDGFSVQKMARTGEEALAFLASSNTPPDLVMLDIYIPDTERLDLFWQLRTSYRDTDIIIISAARESHTILETLRGGIFDYVLKPVDSSRLTLTLNKYKQYRNFLDAGDDLTQGEIDRITGFHDSGALSKDPHPPLPKGIDPITLEKISRIFEQGEVKGITAVELGKQIGTSRSTARRYLEFLVSIGRIQTRLIYGSVGRPERKYLPNEPYEQNE